MLYWNNITYLWLKIFLIVASFFNSNNIKVAYSISQTSLYFEEVMVLMEEFLNEVGPSCHCWQYFDWTHIIFCLHQMNHCIQTKQQNIRRKRNIVMLTSLWLAAWSIWHAWRAMVAFVCKCLPPLQQTLELWLLKHITINQKNWGKDKSIVQLLFYILQFKQWYMCGFVYSIGTYTYWTRHKYSQVIIHE